MAKQNTNFIGGRWSSGYGKTFSSNNPATGEQVWQGSAASQSDVDQTIKAARTAFPGWAKTPLEERIKYLHAFRTFLNAEKEQLAKVISQENGKPLWESQIEVTSIFNKVDISIEAYQKRTSDFIREGQHPKLITRHRPHGVVLVLGPFNFPGHLPHGHIIPALLAGNTVIFKPSEYTPLVAITLMELWEKSGLPPGVLNMVIGGPELGKYLSKHNGIDGLFFTGSLNTGRALLQHFSQHPEKILALEMGGNNPLIVSDITDYPSAAYATIQSAYLTAGQRCSCARRLIVPVGKKGDEFIDVLVQMIQKIKTGPYTDLPEPFMGPVISEAAVVRLLLTEASLHFAGAKFIVRLQQQKEGTGLLEPGLIDVTEVSHRLDEEMFGPFLQLIRVPDFATAIQEANNTQYGLTAGLFSNNQKEYELFYQNSRAGVVNWNVPLTGASSWAPFGGIGCSGNHRPSAYYAADYCVFPVASMESETLQMPKALSPGIDL